MAPPFRDTTFAFHADRKSFYVVGFLNRFEANLRDALLGFI
jgi:hypothetical protein